MKHLSDDDIAQELEKLGQPFKPSSIQKEKIRRGIFTSTRPKKMFRINSLLPTFISLIVLLSVGVGLYITIGDSNTTNVTASWDGMLLEQSSLTSPTRYVLEFNGASLTIKDDFLGSSFISGKVDREAYLRGYKIKEPLLIPGTYEDYTITQKDDTYTLKVDGKTGFTYNFEKLGPRILVGEDGVQYSSRIYLDTLEVITDDITPERLETAP